MREAAAVLVTVAKMRKSATSEADQLMRVRGTMIHLAKLKKLMPARHRQKHGRSDSLEVVVPPPAAGMELEQGGSPRSSP